MTKPDQVTAEAIMAWYEEKPQDFRDHLGASLIGHSCNRYLWLTFRWAVMPKFEGRMLRLFNTGNREEVRIAEELRGIGVELYTRTANRSLCVTILAILADRSMALARASPNIRRTGWSLNARP